MSIGSNGTNGSKRSEQIHVLQIVGNAIVGGMERSVCNLVNGLPVDKFRFTFLCPFQGPFTATLNKMGCAVFVAPLRDDPTWRSLQMAVEIVRHHRIDLIHAHLPNAHVLGGLTGKLTHTPSLVTVHGMSLTVHELGVSRMTETHVIVVCQEAYAQALSLGIEPQNLSLIPNGVNTAFFSPNTDAARFRSALGISADVPLVGFSGRLAWEKGPDEFVRLAARVHRQRPDAHFVIVGDGPLRNQLVAQITDLGLRECVHMAGLCSEMCEVYPALDVLVVTSRSEGMPLAILEAMACEIPVIAMAVGGVAEIIEEGVSGYLIAPGEWRGGTAAYTAGFDGIETVLIDLLDDTKKRKSIGVAARERATKFFDLKTTANLTSDLYMRLANTTNDNRLQSATIAAANAEKVPPFPVLFHRS